VHASAIRSTLLRAGALCALAATAIAGTTAAATASSPAVDKKAAALVPASIVKSGTVSIASDATYAPNEFIAADGHTVIGMDADLAKALFADLGLKVKITNVTFDAIIPALAAGKYEVGASSFTDTLAREKTVNFVDYFEAGTSFFEKSQGGPAVTNLSSLCGLTVSVETGTTEQADATAQGKKCKAEHKKSVTVLAFPSQNNANLALSSGRAQVGMADSPIAGYQVAQSKGAFKLVGHTYGTAPYGIAVPKSTGKLDQAILLALKDLVANGQYASILKKWGVQSGSDTHPVLNGATS
jgi:polar amino acid transport system substrate-binding protein